MHTPPIERIAAVVRGDNMPPHRDDEPRQYPEEWDTQGFPDVIAIDRTNPDHWKRYVWQFVANDETMRKDVESADVWMTSHGYNLEYYPIDTDDWEMIPIGPFCADCVRTDLDNMQPGDAPLAWHCELSDTCDEDSFHKYDRTCYGCGEVLYAVEDAE